MRHISARRFMDVMRYECSMSHPTTCVLSMPMANFLPIYQLRKHYTVTN